LSLERVSDGAARLGQRYEVEGNWDFVRGRPDELLRILGLPPGPPWRPPFDDRDHGGGGAWLQPLRPPPGGPPPRGPMQGPPPGPNGPPPPYPPMRPAFGRPGDPPPSQGSRPPAPPDAPRPLAPAPLLAPATVETERKGDSSSASNAA